MTDLLHLRVIRVGLQEQLDLRQRLAELRLLRTDAALVKAPLCALPPPLMGSTLHKARGRSGQQRTMIRASQG